MTISMVRPKLRIALAQLNLTVGDIYGNTRRIIETALRARDEHQAEVVAFPELALTSYPPEDLLLRPGLYQRVEEALQSLRSALEGIDVIVGHPERQADTGLIYNACSLIREGKRIATYYKQHLPNYSVFDEKRYFCPGSTPTVVDLKGIPTALSICEDIWERGTAGQARAAGAKLLININASPYHIGKIKLRERVLRAAIDEGMMPIVYVNLVGGQDELVFDGASMVMDTAGRIAFRAPEFQEGLYLVEFEGTDRVEPCPAEVQPSLPYEQSIYQALVLGVRDYVRKNRFNGVVLGLSGGIDSALTLAIAVDALGKDQVEAVLMPSRYTATMSLEDAQAEARALGVRYHIICIDPIIETFTESLAPIFAGTAPDVTEENIQARCRGVLLMALSNKKGKMVLATGNKSEMAVGYATLYGDMVGGFAPLKDVPKTLVYRLASWRNSIAPVIPQRVFERPPSAELKPNQKDVDTLPPYPILDPILERYIEKDQTPTEIIKAGFDPTVVAGVVTMVDRNEYKRRQAPPGVRISERAFGRDRRYPITSGYNELSQDYLSN